MKRLFSAYRPLVALAFWLGTALTANAQTAPLARVLVNGKLLDFSSTVPARNYNGTVLVPMGDVFRRLGFPSPTFTPASGSTPARISASKPKPGFGGTYSISFSLGQTSALINGVTDVVPAAAAPRLETTADGRSYTMVPLRWVAKTANCKIEWDQDEQTVQMYYYDELDAGLYFLGRQPDGQNDADGAQKFEPNQPNNPFFDRNKPTIIYVHGIQPGSVANQNREDLRLSVFGNHATQNEWIDKGWNVAIYQWVQLADEENDLAPPYRVESKLYRTTPISNALISLPGTRWRKSDNSFCPPAENLTQTVTDLFLDQYLAALGPYYNQQVEWVGNSMGGNLVTMASQRLIDRGINSGWRFPGRITLMDPFWAGLGSDLLPVLNSYGPNLNTKKLAGQIGQRLRFGPNGVPTNVQVAYYRTSVLGRQGTSDELTQYAAFMQLTPDYAGSSNLAEDPLRRHTMPVRAYFLSVGGCPGLANRAPANNFLANIVRSTSPGCTVPGANEAYAGGANLAWETLQDMRQPRPGSGTVGSGRTWIQTSGFNSFRFSDMRFDEVSYFVGQRAALATADPKAAAAALLDVTLSPNPARGPLSIRYTLPAAGGTTLVQVSDLLGRVRATVGSTGPEAAGPHELQADLSTLPAGPYVLALYQNGVKVKSEKILKAE